MKTEHTSTEVVDYAYPTMMAEKALKSLHSAVLEKKWFEAMEHALLAIKWTTEAHAALKVMEKSDK